MSKIKKGRKYFLGSADSGMDVGQDNMVTMATKVSPPPIPKRSDHTADNEVVIDMEETLHEGTWITDSRVAVSRKKSLVSNLNIRCTNFLF